MVATPYCLTHVVSGTHTLRQTDMACIEACRVSFMFHTQKSHALKHMQKSPIISGSVATEPLIIGLFCGIFHTQKSHALKQHTRIPAKRALNFREHALHIPRNPRCVFVCIHILYYIYTYKYTWIYMYIYIYAYTYVYMNLYAYVNVCINIHMYVCMFICIYIHIYVYVYTHIYIHKNKNHMYDKENKYHCTEQ